MRTVRHRDSRSRLLSERANHMRHEATPSEARLFEAVRGVQLGVAFRLQVPVLGRYIVDLLAPELRLVVEIDGAYHEARRDADARRDRALARGGYCVLRLDAELVMREPPRHRRKVAFCAGAISPPYHELTVAAPSGGTHRRRLHSQRRPRVLL